MSLSRRELLTAASAISCLPSAHRQATARPEPPKGTRIALREGALFLPEGLKPEEGKVPLLLHLHGAVSCTELVPDKTGLPCAVLTFNRNGLSKIYSDAFKSPKRLPELLAECTGHLRRELQADRLEIGSILLSSFSAGFGGVREILSQPENADLPAGILMCDSIYAGFTGDPAERNVDPEHMRGFLAYARLAADTKRRMLITYSQLMPPSYASTSETARYLVRALGGEERSVMQGWCPKLTQRSEFSKGYLRICGFEGDQGEHHMEHLRNLHILVRALHEIGAPKRTLSA
jgi:hypothetical protein